MSELPLGKGNILKFETSDVTSIDDADVVQILATLEGNSLTQDVTQAIDIEPIKQMPKQVLVPAPAKREFKRELVIRTRRQSMKEQQLASILQGQTSDLSLPLASTSLIPRSPISIAGPKHKKVEENFPYQVTPAKPVKKESSEIEFVAPPSECIENEAEDDNNSEKENSSNALNQQPATMNLVVNDKSAIPYMNDVGIFVMYYCRKCVYRSYNLLDVTEHLQTCDQVPTGEDPNPSLEQEATLKLGKPKEPAEHNYAVASEDGNDIQEDTVNESSMSWLAPRKWFCAECASTTFYSKIDFDAHKLCHGEAGNESLHCFLCKAANQPSCLKSNEWSRIKNHLVTAHKYNFKISCKKCQAIFKSHYQYNKHYNIHKKSCKYSPCKFSTDDDKELDIHQKCHNTSNPNEYSCPYCKFKSKGKSTQWAPMCQHIVVRHPGLLKPTYVCPKCDRGFMEMRNFGKHMRFCLGAPKKECRFCNKPVYVDTYDEHIAHHIKKESHHFIEETEELEEIVEEEAKEHELVDKTTDTPPNEDVEMANVEEEEDPLAFVDDVDNDPNFNPKSSADVTVDEEKSKLPKKAVGRPVKVKLEPGDKSCKFRCNKHMVGFTTREEQTKHFIEVHWGITKEKIERAKQEKQTWKELNRKEIQPMVKGETEEALWSGEREDEEEDNSPPKMFRLINKCKLCYKRFVSEANLFRHMERVHPPEKRAPVLCTTCGKSFRNKPQLRNHVRETHEGKKRKSTGWKYKPKVRICDICGYTTPSGMRLKNHRLSVHEGLMPYKCNKCDYETNESSDLRRHKWRHNDFKKYACEFCPYKSNQRWLLVNHCRHQHNIALPVIRRNTMGTMYSVKWQKKMAREKAELEREQDIVDLDTRTEPQEIIIKPTKMEELIEQTEFILQTENEQEYAVEMIDNEHGGQTIQEVVYIQGDDNTTAEEALMLLAYGGAGTPVHVEQTRIIQTE